MAINLITRVEPKVMERLYQESVTQGLFSKQYNFKGARTIEIMSVDTVPLTAYNRSLAGTTAGTIGKRFGEIVELGDTKATYTMNDEVKYNIGFEKSTGSDQGDIKTASSIISRQDREVVVPYRDKYRLQKLALGAGLNKFSATTAADLGKAKIIETLLKARAALRNNYASMGGQVLYVGETNAIEMKLADQVIGVDKIAENPIVNGVINKLAGFQLNIVPDEYLPSKCAFLIVTKGSAWAPVKVKTSRIITDHPDFDGTAVQYHEYHDCFVNAARKNTIYACWTSASAQADELLESASSTDSGGSGGGGGT